MAAADNWACLSPQSGKAGGILDRRFGEADPTLDADDKALRRLQRLRQNQLGKGGRFALGGALHRLRLSCDVQLILTRPVWRWCADDEDDEPFGRLGDTLQDDFVPSDQVRNCKQSGNTPLALTDSARVADARTRTTT